MPAGGKCIFNLQWLTGNDYRNWLQSVKGERHNAFCKVWNRKFSLVSMGVAALKSHVHSCRHQKLSKKISSLNPISSFVTPATNTTIQASKDGNKTEEVQSGSHHRFTISVIFPKASLMLKFCGP